MTKIIQFNNKFDVLYSRENNPWIGGVPCLTSTRVLFPKDFEQDQVVWSELYREATQKQGMIGQEDGISL